MWLPPSLHRARCSCGSRPAVSALHAAGRTRVVLEQRPLAAVNDAIDDVLAARVDARVVLVP